MKRLFLAVALTTALSAQEKAAEGEKEVITKDEMIVWKWANFLLLAGVAGYFLNKQLPPYFKARSSEIQKDITEAEKTKQAADKRAAEMDARLSSLGADIERFRVEAKAEMEREAGRIRQETAHQIEKLQKQAAQEIESAGTLASRELRAYAAKLSLDLAEQRIRTRLDASTEAGLVDDFTKELGSKN